MAKQYKTLGDEIWKSKVEKIVRRNVGSFRLSFVILAGLGHFLHRVLGELTQPGHIAVLQPERDWLHIAVMDRTS